MRRKLLTFFSAMSLLLFVAVCGLWVRSHRIGTAAGFTGGQDETYLASNRGQLYLVLYCRDDRKVLIGSKDGFTHWDFEVRPDKTGPQSKRFAGFSVYGNYPLKYGEYVEIGVHYGYLAVVFVVLPVTWVWCRRRPGPGCCPTCGYDLRATPDRCPECGRAVA